MLIAVTGRVFADKPIACELSPAQGAIVQLREEKKTSKRAVSASVWLTDTETLRSSIREAEWGLTDGSKLQLPVVDGRHAEGDSLQMSGDVWTPASETAIGTIIGELGGLYLQT
jgi:hypothetical protein